MAPYKKTLSDVASHWCFSMRAALCWFLPSPGRGRREDKRPSCVARAVGIRCRPSRRSACRRGGSGWRFIFDSMSTKTFVPRKWFSSSGICADISGKASSWYGTAVPFTNRAWLTGFWKTIRVFKRTGSRDTPPSSIPMNSCGPNSKGRWPTACRKIFTICMRFCALLSGGCAVLKNFCGRVSMRLDCLGVSCSITFA